MMNPAASSTNQKRPIMAWMMTVGAAAGCLAANAAYAQDFKASALISAFETMCVATNADANAAQAVAVARGWTAGDPLDGAPALFGEEAGGRQALTLGEKVGEISSIPIKASSCAVIATVDDPKAVVAYAEKRLDKIKPNTADDRGKQWIYAQTAQGLRPIIGQDDAVKVIRAGQYRELIVSDMQSDDLEGNIALQLTVGVSP